MDGPRAWTQMCRTKHVPFAAKAVLYRDGESRRPAFLTRPVARNSPKRLRLSGYCRVTDQTSEDCLIRWRSKFIEVSGSDCFRKVWALLGWCTESGCMIGKLNVLTHTQYAVMLSVPAATGGQVRLTLRRHREERRGQRQAENGQQQNGQNLPQCSDLSTERPSIARTDGDRIRSRRRSFSEMWHQTI